MRRTLIPFLAIAALVAALAAPASARPTVRGETYKVDCVEWGVTYVQPAPMRGIVAWEEGAMLGPSLMIAAGIWFPGETIPPSDEIPRLSGRDASLCEITGPREGGEQLDIFAYFVKMPGFA
jgi:hypothetical protein